MQFLRNFNCVRTHNSVFITIFAAHNRKNTPLGHDRIRPMKPSNEQAKTPL